MRHSIIFDEILNVLKLVYNCLSTLDMKQIFNTNISHLVLLLQVVILDMREYELACLPLGSRRDYLIIQFHRSSHIWSNSGLKSRVNLLQ